MKLIHLISGGDVGGAKTHVHTLLKGLCATETVQLVCFTDGPFAREAAALGIPTRVMTGRLPTILRSLRKLIREEGYELIHCHGSRANMIGSILKRKLDLPAVTTVHSDYRLDYMGRPFAAATYGVINKLALRKMDNWIGVSEVTVDMLLSRGFDPNRTFTIVNGVPFDDVTPRKTREQFLRDLGIEPQEGMTVFGIAARINPVKDMQTLVRAFAKTVEVCPLARLVIAGDGEQRQQIEQLARELCPPGTVAFAGWLNDTDSFYSAIDVNMLTSVSEGFPYALPEGGRWSCATIASRVGGIPSLVEHEVNGLLFEPKDVETLSGHMIRLARDAELCRTFGQRLYEKTRAGFSVDATVARQKQIYETIFRRRARAEARPRDGILICGAYGRGNSGDDAILKSIVTQFRKWDPDLPVYVTSRTPNQTGKDARACALFTFNSLRIRRVMKRTALYLSGGGSLIQDSTSSRSLWYYLSSIRRAKRLGNKVMMFGCGIGPVRWKRNRRMAGRVINRCVDSITLRDRNALEELERLQVRDIPVRVTADMAFLLEPADPSTLSLYFRRSGLEEEGKYLLIAPRPWQDTRQQLEALTGAAKYAWQTRGLTPLLFAMEPNRDRDACAQIAGALDGVPHLQLDADPDVSLVVGLMRRVQGVLGMRLHALIFAASQGTPFAGIAYDPKVSGFLDYLGRGDYCSMEDCTLPRLRQMVDALAEEPAQADAGVARLRTLAEENCRIAEALYAEAMGVGGE